MQMDHPQEAHRLFREAFNARDLDGLMMLYEPDAMLSPQPGVQARGKEQVRAALREYLALHATMDMRTVSCRVTGGVAVMRAAWRLTGTRADGRPLEMEGVSLELLRPQRGGGWKIAVDYPNGAAGWRVLGLMLISQAVSVARLGVVGFCKAWFQRVVQNPVEHVLLINHVPGAEGTQHRVYPKALWLSALMVAAAAVVIGAGTALAIGGLMGLIQFLWAMYLIAMGLLVLFACVMVVVIFWVAFR